MVTGTLSDKRAAIEQDIKSRGGTIRTAVSGNVDYLIAGEKPGSKLTAAQEKNVKVINEAGLNTLASGGTPRRLTAKQMAKLAETPHHATKAAQEGTRKPQKATKGETKASASKPRADMEKVEDSLIRITPNEEGTSDCHAVDVSGLAYHVSSQEIEKFRKPDNIENSFAGFKNDPPPATYFTPNMEVATGAAWHFGDGTPYYHTVDIDLDDAVDCRALLEDEPLKTSQPKSQRSEKAKRRQRQWNDVLDNIYEAKVDKKDGVIIPSTFDDHPGMEYVVFNPQTTAHIVDVQLGSTRGFKKPRRPTIPSKKRKTSPSGMKGAPKLPGKRR